MKNSVTAIILRKDKKFLAVKRAFGLHKEKWAFPGGLVKENEAEEEALKREIKEEVDLDIKIIKKISSFRYLRENKKITKGVCYLAEPKNELVKTNSEISEFKWLTLEEFESLEHIPSLEDEAFQALFS